VLASGPGHGNHHCHGKVRRRIQPVFDAIAGRTLWVGPVGDGSRLKLVLNIWLASTVEAAAEAVALAEGLALDATLLLEVLDGGPLASAYARDKARAMLAASGHGDDDVASVVDGLTRPAPPSDAQVATARLPRQ
jgi:3-hydroxyisobutyrate dehydrogenase-like beta-hydroxyacid dehydrogenase